MVGVGVRFGGGLRVDLEFTSDGLYPLSSSAASNPRLTVDLPADIRSPATSTFIVIVCLCVIVPDQFYRQVSRWPYRHTAPSWPTLWGGPSIDLSLGATGLVRRSSARTRCQPQAQMVRKRLRIRLRMLSTPLLNRHPRPRCCCLAGRGPGSRICYVNCYVARQALRRQSRTSNGPAAGGRVASPGRL